MEKHPISFEQLPSLVYELGQKIDLLFQRLDQSTSAAPVDEILTIEQAAKLLDLTTQTIYSLVSDQKIPFSKPTGGRVYFSRLSLMDWLSSSRKMPIADQVAQYEKTRALRPARRQRTPSSRKSS